MIVNATAGGPLAAFSASDTWIPEPHDVAHEDEAVRFGDPRGAALPRLSSPHRRGLTERPHAEPRRGIPPGNSPRSAPLGIDPPRAIDLPVLDNDFSEEVHRRFFGEDVPMEA